MYLKNKLYYTNSEVNYMTKKDLQKAIRWLKKDTEIIYKDEKNVVHGIEKICYSVDSDGHTFLILEAKKIHK